MTLDEAIQHCEEKGCYNTECAIEHRQLAEWLRELKKYHQERQFKIDDWVFNEIVDTLNMAQVTLLKITGLDSSDEIRRKSIENESAITRRIEKAIKLMEDSK